MLPAPTLDAPSLADVLESCLLAVLGEPSVLGLPAVDRALVVLVDGLGDESLRARSGHARHLSGLAGRAIDSGFPTTTATALASLTTGRRPGEHGLVGYSALDIVQDRVLNQLTGWGPGMSPEVWQPVPTLFERARDRGVDAVAIGPDRYRDSGFTRAVLRGARYLGARTIEDRVAAARAWLRSGTRGIGYLYIPELDVASHAHGWQSHEWTAALETTDSALRDLDDALRAADGVIVTADHGVIDIASHDHVLIDERPGLLDGVRHVAGEPRCLQLHLEPGVDLSEVQGRWSQDEADRAWVFSRQELIDSGWFGPVRDDVRSRIGDLMIAARTPVAYYDGRVAGASRAMIGQHGSFSDAERRIPVLGMGAFA